MLKVREVKNYKTLVNVNVIRPAVSVVEIRILSFHRLGDKDTILPEGCIPRNGFEVLEEDMPE